MSRSVYYEKMKTLAREERLRFGWSTPRVLRSHLRAAYKFYQIRIDLWPYALKAIRGAYFCDENGVSVLLNRNLPEAPYIFTMAHELKHHLVDQDLAYLYCGEYNVDEPIEIGAEVFAAELIYPENDFSTHLSQMGVRRGLCRPENLVRLKHDTGTTLSYAGLAKRAVFLGFASNGSFDKVRWVTLEEQIYGEPVYKQIQRLRRRGQ